MKAQDPQKVIQFLDLAVDLGLHVYASYSDGSGYYRVEKCACNGDYYFYAIDRRYDECFRLDVEEVEKGLLTVEEVHFNFKYNG